MDLPITLNMPEERKEALRQAVVAGALALPEDLRLYFFTGALYGLEEIRTGEFATPSDIALPEFRAGRDLVVTFAL